MSTTIQVSEKARKRLAALKRDPRETYESVILRALAAGSGRAEGAAREGPTWMVVAEVKRALQSLYGERFERLVVYGSVARGEATSRSDIDLLLVLHGDVDVGAEIDRIREVTYEIDLRHGTLASVLPISLGDFLARVSPLLMNVRREGVTA